MSVRIIILRNDELESVDANKLDIFPLIAKMITQVKIKQTIEPR